MNVKSIARCRLAAPLLIAASGLCALPALAQPAYPAKPVNVIVGFPAGSGTDVVARHVSDGLSKRLGQPFVVDNRPGVSGSLSAGLAARAKPDGYTLFVSGSASQVINPHLFRNLTYNPKTDFSPIGQIAWLPYLLVVKQGSPYKTLAQLVDAAKKAPGEIAFGSTGVGAGAHLVMSVLMSQTGTQMSHIPYKGSGQILSDIQGEQIVTTFDTMPAMLPMVKGGKLHALAISTRQRSPIVPDVPTVAEQGYPDFDMGVWLGFMAPAGLPKDIQDKLANEINLILKDPEFRKSLMQLGAEPRATASPEEFKQIIARDYEYWGNLIKKFNVKPQ